LGRIIFYFLAQATDVDVDDAGVLDLSGWEPEVFKENLPAENMTGMIHEEREQVELGAAEFFLFVSEEDLHPVSTEAQYS